MEKSKLTVQGLYDHITKILTPEVALKKLLSSSLLTYEKLKFDPQNEPVHPLIIISMATMDLGWQFAVETGEEGHEVRGLVVGTEEYIDTIFPTKSKIAKLFDELYEEIKHGDEDHQKWLKDTMNKFGIDKKFIDPV